MLIAAKVLLTAYCWCTLCTGHEHGITKSGIPATPNLTVACSPELLNKLIYIVGLGNRVCHDTGSRITKGRVDVYFESHEEALKFGVKRSKMYHPRVEK